MIIRVPLKKIFITFLCVFSAGLILAFAMFISKRTSAAGSPASNYPIIVIDAGHGGFDGGAVAPDGTNEKDLNLEIALKLEDIMTACGFDVVMVRTNDTSTDSSGESIRSKKVSDMKNRLDLMNKYANSVFISIHLNKFETTSPNGAQVFYAPSADGSQKLAERIQASIAKMVQPENNRVIKSGTKDTYLLYNAKVPAVIVECGFLSNAGDLANLKTDDYQKRLAFAIASGFLNYYYES